VIPVEGVDVRLGVGEPLVLHVQRRSAPWRAVSSEELEADACHLTPPPPGLEIEVAGNVCWIVEPEGAAG